VTRKERMLAVLRGDSPDRTPVLGGWIACPDHICALTGATREQYWADPIGLSIRAYDVLGTDGLADVFVPQSKDDFRCVDRESYVHASTDCSVEEVIAEIDSMPSPKQIEREFDFDQEYESFADELGAGQARAGNMLWMPPQWEASATLSWYEAFGYENFFLLVGAYEDHAVRLMEIAGARARCRCRLIARAVEDGIYPPAVLLGEDICSQRGPMISPRFIQQHYIPQLRHGLQPLLDVGCRPVWHCDGDVTAILDMVIGAGVQGLQGFQPECGMTVEYVATKRTREGGRLLIFGPIAVTTELPVCSPEEIQQKVRHAVGILRGKADLVLFTSNTINPDVPLENVRAMYEAVREQS